MPTPPRVNCTLYNSGVVGGRTVAEVGYCNRPCSRGHMNSSEPWYNTGNGFSVSFHFSSLRLVDNECCLLETIKLSLIIFELILNPFIVSFFHTILLLF